jgi:hypothetical protein
MKTTQNSPITATVQRPKKHPKSVQLDLITQPWMVLRPTPPAPNTIAEDPASILAVLSTAPTRREA